MFGDCVAKKIKEYNGVKIILISAYDLDHALVKELEENKYIAKYVEKPIQLASLFETVASTIGWITHQNPNDYFNRPPNTKNVLKGLT